MRQRRSCLYFYALIISVVQSRDRNVLAELIQNKLKNVENWLRQSGIKVNEAKTCLCLFFHRDTAPIEITLDGIKMRSNASIKVLGVIFDQKLQWSDHIAHCSKKSSKALIAIGIIKRFFTTKELL